MVGASAAAIPPASGSRGCGHRPLEIAEPRSNARGVPVSGPVRVLAWTGSRARGLSGGRFIIWPDFLSGPPQRQHQRRLALEVAQLQPHRIAVRVDKALDPLVETGELLADPGPYLRQARRIVDALPAAEDRHQQVPPLRPLRNGLAPRQVFGVDHRRRGREWAAFVPDHVSHEVSLPLAEAADLEDAGVGGLRRLLGELDPVLPMSAGARLAHRRQLVDAAQGRIAVAGDQAGPHPPDADRGPLPLEIGDQGLVEVVAGQDLRFGEPCFVENAARLPAQPGEVAGVEADADHLW